MVVNTITRELNQVTNRQTTNYSPSIDGLGETVVFQSYVGGFSQIFLVKETMAGSNNSVGGETRPRRV